jgi:recombination protein RecA
MSSVAVPVSSLPRPSAAELRRSLEAELADRIPGALSPRERVLPDMVSSGIAALDELTGGWPRGTLTELFGPASSGRATVLLAALAAATARGEACALIDAGDCFDPESAANSGVDLKKLLWIRCGKNPPQRHRDRHNLLLTHPERAPKARVEGPLPTSESASGAMAIPKPWSASRPTSRVHHEVTKPRRTRELSSRARKAREGSAFQNKQQMSRRLRRLIIANSKNNPSCLRVFVVENSVPPTLAWSRP